MASAFANALTTVLDRTDPMTLVREGATLAVSAAAMKAVTYAGTLAASRAMRGSPILGNDPAAPPRHRVKVAHMSLQFTKNIVKAGFLGVPVHMLAQLSVYVTKHRRDLEAKIIVLKIGGYLGAINDVLTSKRDPDLQSTIIRAMERVRLLLQMLLSHLKTVTLRDTPKFFEDARNMGIKLMESLQSCVDSHTAAAAARRALRARRTTTKTLRNK
jgi:hypothetical protein